MTIKAHSPCFHLFTKKRASPHFLAMMHASNTIPTRAHSWPLGKITMLWGSMPFPPSPFFSYLILAPKQGKSGYTAVMFYFKKDMSPLPRDARL